MANPYRPKSYNKLEIHIRHGSSTSFLLSASGTVSVPNPNDRTEIDLAGPELGRYLELLETGEVDEDFYNDFGVLLFNLLFRGNIKTAYDNSLQDALDKDKDGVRIVLNLTRDAAKLYLLPWVLLYDGEREWWLGGFGARTNQRTPLSFSVDGTRALSPVHETPLRVLVIGARPNELEPINVQAEVNVIEDTLADLVKRGSMEIEVLATSEGGPVTRDTLARRLRSFRPHVLHCICHGPLNRGDPPVLFLEHKDGTKDPYRVRALHGAMQVGGGTVRFAVLNSCNSDGAARFLAGQGIPSIGTATPIRGDAAEPFSRGLYRAIADGVPIDEAVNRAREEIRQAPQPAELDWISPVLYLPFGKVVPLLPSPSVRSSVQEPPAPRPAPPELSTLKVESNPRGAEIRINGVSRGSTPRDVEVTPGRYHVGVRKRGSLTLPRARTTWVGPGAAAVLRFRLLSLRWAWLLLALPLAVLMAQHLWVVWTRVPPGMARLTAGSFQKGGKGTPMVNLVRKYATIPGLELLLESEPTHGRIVRVYWIDRYEVRNEDYGRFLESLAEVSPSRHRQLHPDEPAGHDHVPDHWYEPSYDNPEQPVVGVDFHDAAAYCRGAGKRLPTADEWERAARGTDGRLYPWGNAFDPTAASTGEAPEQAPVRGGTYPKDRSPDGVFDLGGNVAEWTATPAESAGHDSRMVVGGSWTERGEVYSLVFLRRPAALDVRSLDLGFRCAAAAAAGREPPPGMVPIPAGPFLQGGEDSTSLDLARRFNLRGPLLTRVLGEEPARANGRELLLDRHEVTNEEYRRFLERSTPRAQDGAGGAAPDNDEPAGWADPLFSDPRQPVVGVDWFEARAYCRWAGKRLPTDEEWERAVRGPDGRHYPWGDEFDPARCQSREAPSRPEATAPVGSHPDCVSPEGILDLVGNADEWTADAADASGGSDARIIRGGGWGDPGEVRGLGWVKVRATADYRKKDIGFRCAADPRPSWLETLWPW